MSGLFLTTPLRVVVLFRLTTTLQTITYGHFPKHDFCKMTLNRYQTLGIQRLAKQEDQAYLGSSQGFLQNKKHKALVVPNFIVSILPPLNSGHEPLAQPILCVSKRFPYRQDTWLGIVTKKLAYSSFFLQNEILGNSETIGSTY